jgi:hypothetical protein
MPATGSATSASKSSLTPEDIADTVVYALDVHEKQLRELRPDADELKRLTMESIGKPLAGYTKVPTELAERDAFFAAMKALIEREPKTGYE